MPEGVDDWVVLQGGATAVFRVRSLVEAARLAERVASVKGLEGSEALLTVADDRVTLRLTRGLWQLEPRHVELARAISGARACDAVGDRAAVQEVRLAIAGKRPRASASTSRNAVVRAWSVLAPAATNSRSVASTSSLKLTLMGTSGT